jgi:hypothetical protein
MTCTVALVVIFSVVDIEPKDVVCAAQRAIRIARA